MRIIADIGSTTAKQVECICGNRMTINSAVFQIGQCPMCYRLFDSKELLKKFSEVKMTSEIFQDFKENKEVSEDPRDKRIRELEKEILTLRSVLRRG